MNLANCVRFWARWDPDGVHIHFDGRDTTWSELDERTSRLANGLAARGVGHGDRVVEALGEFGAPGRREPAQRSWFGRGGSLKRPA